MFHFILIVYSIVFHATQCMYFFDWNVISKSFSRSMKILFMKSKKLKKIEKENSCGEKLSMGKKILQKIKFFFIFYEQKIKINKKTYWNWKGNSRYWTNDKAHFFGWKVFDSALRSHKFMTFEWKDELKLFHQKKLFFFKKFGIFSQKFFAVESFKLRLNFRKQLFFQKYILNTNFSSLTYLPIFPSAKKHNKFSFLAEAFFVLFHI